MPEILNVIDNPYREFKRVSVPPAGNRIAFGQAWLHGLSASGHLRAQALFAPASTMAVSLPISMRGPRFSFYFLLEGDFSLHGDDFRVSLGDSISVLLCDGTQLRHSSRIERNLAPTEFLLVYDRDLSVVTREGTTRIAPHVGPVTLRNLVLDPCRLYCLLFGASQFPKRETVATQEADFAIRGKRSDKGDRLLWLKPT